MKTLSTCLLLALSLSVCVDAQGKKNKSRKGGKAGKQNATANVKGPITSSGDSVYYYYIPDTALEDAEVPALFWTNASGGGNEKKVAAFKTCLLYTSPSPRDA